MVGESVDIRKREQFGRVHTEWFGDRDDYGNVDAGYDEVWDGDGNGECGINHHRCECCLFAVVDPDDADFDMRGDRIWHWKLQHGRELECNGRDDHGWGGVYSDRCGNRDN